MSQTSDCCRSSGTGGARRKRQPINSPLGHAIELLSTGPTSVIWQIEDVPADFSAATEVATLVFNFEPNGPFGTNHCAFSAQLFTGQTWQRPGNNPATTPGVNPRRWPAPLMALAALSAAVVALPAGATGKDPAAWVGAPCTGDTTAAGVPQLPGRKLRMGINPAGRAGAIGPPVPLTPISYSKTLAALAKLRPRKGPFVLRLNRFFWSDDQNGVRHFLKLTRLYTKRGYRVELQLRYHPTPEQEGHIHAWVRFVREVVRRFGANPRVIGLQVTNEVNFYPIAPDASDSAFKRARVALIHGIEAAHRTARRRHFHQLQIGFNWAYRTDPSREAGFWGYLRDHGAKRFARSVDWVGLDAYPGTIFPPTEPPTGSGYRDGMVNAMSVLRECYMPIARLGNDIPIHVEENGWPTGPGRSERQQVRSMEQMVGAVNDFRGTYNVTDYRWFDLRDHNTSGPNFQQHYGLLHDDYSPKPAFDTYRGLVMRYNRWGAR